MKNTDRIRTNNRRTIIKAFPRFVSLMVMSLLGVFVFAGLMATAPDMIHTLDNYLDDRDVYDIRIVSDMGLTEEDISEVGKLDGVEEAVGGKSLDIVVPNGDTELVIQCCTVTEGVNVPEVIDGHLPEAENEIAVESAFLEEHDLRIGDKISTDSTSLKQQTLTIVGEVISPLYYNAMSTSHQRGSSSVGRGTVDYYAYIFEENLNLEVYTVLYVRVEGAEKLITSQSDYTELVQKVIDEIDWISAAREQDRYDSIIESGNEQIQEAEEQAYEKLDEKWEELQPKIEELLEGRQQLAEAGEQLNSGKTELETARTQLDAAREQLEASSLKLEEGKQQLDYSAEELASNKEKLDAAESQLSQFRMQLDEAKVQLENAKTQLDAGASELESSKEILDENEKKLGEAKAELEAAKETLDSSRAELDSGWEQYDQALEDSGLGLIQPDDYADTLQTLADAAGTTVAECDARIAEYDQQITECDDSTEGLAKKAWLEKQREWTVSARDEAQTVLNRSTELQDKLRPLAEAQAKLEAGEAEYQSGKTQYDAAEAEYEEGKQQWEDGKARYEQGIEEYQANQELYNRKKAEYDASELQYSEALSQYEAGKMAYTEGEEQYQEGLEQYQTGLNEYETAREEYESGEEQYAEGMEIWEEGEASYASAKQIYNDSLEKYRSSMADTDYNLIDLDQDFESREDAQALYDSARESIRQQADEAREELKSVSMPTWYVYDREGYSTYGDFIDDAGSIRNLAAVFPPIFFAVAVLISLISMKRMVEEDRMEIGTMKSMGFENRQIRGKYTGFALLATMAGGLIGAVGGLIIIPSLIYRIYGLLFDLPSLILTLQPVTTILGFVITVLCVCGTTVFTVSQVLKEKPSELMRPKAPKNGKRVLMERLTVLWSRMSFSQKITVRNLARYKKRVIVTIIGIAGCTALILTGFGIRDSITDIPEAQYEDILHFDGMAVVKQYVPKNFRSETDITAVYPVQQISAQAFGQSVYMYVVNDSASLTNLMTLRDSETGEELTPEEGTVIITEKFASMNGVKKGDILNFIDVNNNTFSLEVSGIVDNYVQHYIYLTADTYETFGLEFAPNLIYFNIAEINGEEQDLLMERLLSDDNILSVTYKTTLLQRVSDMLSSLNSVVVILLVLAAMLFFVVLYNLANININERQREIATLKVLGFYDREVDSYITRENIFMTAIGILAGFALGIVVSHQVVANVEIDYCRFINHLQPISYVYTAAFAILFTGIVDLIIHFNLKRIDMIDSLKSVE